MKDRQDGSGSIYRDAQRGGWVAQIRYYDEFTQTSKKVRRRATSRDEARAKLAELRSASPSTSKATATTTISAYLDHYEAIVLPTIGLSPATQELHKTLIINPLKPTLGEVRLCDFDAITAARWLARLEASTTLVKSEKMKARPLSGSTKHKAYFVLAKALDRAVADGLIPANPLRSMSAPKEGKAIVPTVSASDFDEKILPAVAGTSSEHLVTFVGLTGCRVGEALGLRWADVDLDNATATFRRSSASTDATKTGKVRTVPLVPEVVASLKARRKVQRDQRLRIGVGWQNKDGLIFTTVEGRPVDVHNARRDYSRILKANGLATVRPFHSLRHGLATRLLQRNVPMHVVSAILGHSNIAMTVNTYGHVEPVLHAEQLAAALGR